MKMMTNWPPRQRWKANSTNQSRDRWRSLREFGRPASDSLPRGWSRWPAMFLDHDQDVMFQNTIWDYNVYSHDILWMVMSSQAPRRCGRWPEYGRRSQPQSLQQPSGHWCLTSHLLFIITFTFFIQLHSSIFSSIFCTLMFGIVFSSLHFSFIFKQFTFT